MNAWVDLRKRRCEPEIMDDPVLEPRRHIAALHGMERINQWSRSDGIIWSAIAPLFREADSDGLRILDVATGAGDVPIGLLLRARRAGLKLRVDACDASPTALEHVRRQAALAAVDMRVFKLDALCEDLPADYDVVVSSLFFHHLADQDAVSLLARMARASRRLVVLNDLVRSPAGLILAYIGSRILTPSDVVHVDAIRSVRAAFTTEEIRRVAERAGLRDVIIRRRWPRRFLLTWRRPLSASVV
jgi:2-polyprenyl-3-methyl-5-hydroxy-6-metoxy-1,4-benzoquinol methylase